MWSGESSPQLLPGTDAEVPPGAPCRLTPCCCEHQASRALAGDSAGGAGGSDLAVGPRIYPDAWWTHRAGQRGAAGLEVPLGRVAAPLLSLARARILTTLCLALGGLVGGAAAGAGSGASVRAAAVAVA